MLVRFDILVLQKINAWAIATGKVIQVVIQGSMIMYSIYAVAVTEMDVVADGPHLLNVK